MLHGWLCVADARSAVKVHFQRPAGSTAAAACGGVDELVLSFRQHEVRGGWLVPVQGMGQEAKRKYVET